MNTDDLAAIAEAILTQPATPAAPPARLSWEVAHRAYSYRIDPALHDELKRIRDELSDGDNITTLDLVADALIAAGIEAYCAGQVQVTCMHSSVVRRGRP